MKSITRRSFVGGAGAGLAALGLAACGNSSSSDSSSLSSSSSNSDDRSGNVYWLNFKPELDTAAQQLASDYMEKYPNVKVKVQTAASGTYEQTLTSEMDKSEAPTLFVIGNQAAVKEWTDYAMDLSDTPIADELTTNDYNLYDESGKLVSIGYCYECYGIVVNKDLVEKAGHSVDDIKDFASLKTVVEDIHKNASTLGFDAFVATDLDSSASWRVTGHLANLEYFYEEKDSGSKWTKTPATISGKYLPNYKNLFDLAINNSLVEPNTLATGGHDPVTEFAEGKAAFIFTGSFGYTDFKGKVANSCCIPYYCGVDGEENAGLNCGTENCWAINDNASDEDKKATMDFMVWLVSDPDASKTMVENLGILPYKNAPEGDIPYLNNAAEYTEKGCYTMDWATNFQPNVNDYRAALVSALNSYTADPSDATWADVKTAFVDGWASNYKKVNG